MSSAKSEPAANEWDASGKAEWVQPSVTQLDVGDAESSDGPGPDGGLAS
jgi:hypothetical protein